MIAPIWYVGNLDPSVTETITSDGVAVNLTGATVKFKMRAVGSTTLKIDANAVIVTALEGKVRYDWQAADVDTAGFYLVWWTVTIGGKTQDVGEALIEFRAHGTVGPLYVEPEELKTLISLEGTTYADTALVRACQAASRGVDLATGRRFWLDEDNTSVRTYTPTRPWQLEIDDVVDLQTVKIDRTGDGTYEETWTEGTEFILGPQNAPQEVPPSPYEWIRCRRYSAYYLPVEVEKSVQVKGQFGWAAVPEEIRTVTGIIASKMLRRVREAPFGIVAVGGLETGIAARIARTDPDVEPILCAYTRRPLWQ